MTAYNGWLPHSSLSSHTLHALLLFVVLPTAAPADPAGIAFFEKKIRPVLIKRCYKCHSGKQAKGKLQLDTRQATRKGGESGPAVVPGNIKRSVLIQAIRHENFEMPPNGKLSDRQIADFEHWVKIGAPDPRTKPSGKAANQSWDKIVAKRSKIWSLQPVRRQALPKIVDVEWAQPVDRFIRQRLLQAKLQPAKLADRATLLRRLSFALRGIPPTPAEVVAIQADRHPDAYLRLVDRLLNSPLFGERWARHWMDVVRFTETQGHEWNFEIKGAWHYRDYLIRAFNQDVRYDTLIREHIAGDLIKPRWNRVVGVNESLIATNFYRFGEAGHDNCLEFREISLDVLDNQIDTLTKAFQAMTVSCARCHDHKLDAVSNKDYYALSGVIGSSRYISRTIDDPKILKDQTRRLTQLKEQVRRKLGQQWLAEIRKTKQYLLVGAGKTKSKSLNQQQLGRWKSMLAKASKSRPGLDDPLRPWHALATRKATGKRSAGKVSEDLAKQYKTDAIARQTFNQTNFQPWGAVKAEPNSKSKMVWHREGASLAGDADSPNGEFTVAIKGDHIVGPILPAGLYTNRLSDRLNGGLRSPLLPKNKTYISLKVMGGSKGVLRRVFDNCHLGLVMQDLTGAEPKWVTLGTNKKYTDSNIYVALVTKLDSQVYPIYNTRHPVKYSEFRSHFGITDAVVHDCSQPPKESLDHLVAFTASLQSSIKSKADPLAALAEHYQSRLEQAVTAWIDGKCQPADVRWLSWLYSNKLLPNSLKKAGKDLQGVIQQYRAIEAQIKRPRVINSIADINRGFDVPLRIRGDPFQLGAKVPRQYVSVLAGKKNAVFRKTRGSGRVELAELIANAENPLTARVMVNRLWHHLFGTGIVATPDDFGHIGERPSHPRLLDYLATRFVERGWSVKQMIREIVLSRTYRMSSKLSKKGHEQDPTNKLLHHFPLRRLEAEAIRDSLLTVSGRLDRSMYGLSIHPYRFKERLDRRLFKGPLDGKGRRSIYTKLTLTEEPPFLTTFNLPEAKIARGRREVTSVPAQALAMMNDPFVHQQAGVWADGLINDGIASIDQRVGKMLSTALGRSTGKRETERFVRVTHKLAQLRKVSADDIMSSKVVWKDVAHLIFNLKEFIYVR